MPHIILDTNILLLDANNLLSVGKDAIVVLPETVLDEIDSKKSGHTEIAFQARAFGRLLAKAERIQLIQHDNLVITELKLYDQTIRVISVKHYPNYTDTEPAIISDRKIIYAAQLYADHHEPPITFMSNDVMCRLRAQAEGLTVTDLKDVQDTEILFHRSLVVPFDSFSTLHNKPILEIDPLYEPQLFSYEFTCSVTAQVKFALIQDGYISIIGKDSEKKLREQLVNPSNAEQLIMSAMIQDQTIDLTICEALAGSGKTLMAMSNAMKLVATNSPYDNIVYIRNTVDDVAERDEEIGFLSGNDEKMAIYLHPYHDTLASIARMELKGKYKPSELEEKINEKVESYISKYHMQAMIALGLRGRTFDNSIIIVDEAQNMSKATMQKVLSRVGKNCKVIVIGSLRQIDSKYISKYTAGLAVLLDSTKRSDLPIKLNAIQLHKVVRGPVTAFAEMIFSAKG